MVLMRRELAAATAAVVAGYDEETTSCSRSALLQTTVPVLLRHWAAPRSPLLAAFLCRRVHICASCSSMSPSLQSTWLWILDTYRRWEG
uniref:Uncharacterized protein n=1 Tax=Arundo donax TaxID=35708 RepID=A0A0A9DL91_ARUDO